jgi:phage-related protein
MEKDIIKKVKRANKSKKPKIKDGTKKLVDAITAVHNDPQKMLRYDIRSLFWKILTENYELTIE